jgi:Tfp pilus assembly protein PilF
MKRIFLLSYLSLSIIFLFVLELHSQEGRGQGRLSGFIVDEAGNPVEGAKVTVQYINYSYRLETTTNKKGQWALFGLGKGEVDITVEKEGISGHLRIPVSGVSKNPTIKIVLKKGGTEPSPGESTEGLRNALVQGNELFEQKKYAEALVIYQELVKNNPRLYLVRLNVGNCYMELQEYDKAISEYLKLLDDLSLQDQEKKDNKLIAQVYAAIGDAYLRQDKFEEAQDYFLKSINIDQSDPAIPFNIAEIMMNVGKTDEAIKYYEISIKVAPDRAKPYLKLGYAWLNKGDIKKAVDYFKKVVELTAPDDPDSVLAKELIKNLSEIK